MLPLCVCVCVRACVPIPKMQADLGSMNFIRKKKENLFTCVLCMSAGFVADLATVQSSHLFVNGWPWINLSHL